jgi:hypothetical protein
MDAIFWAALGFLVVATIAGTAYVGVRAWRAWQACISLAVVGAAGADILTGRVAETAARAEKVTARVDELLTTLTRLERSRARGRVLLGGVEEVAAVVRSILAFAPKK